jgi:hypothetical protein
MCAEKKLENAVSNTDHLAEITYTFECDTPNPTAIINGKECHIGEKQLLENVPLRGVHYELEIEVDPNGIGNWSLKFDKIIVLDSGFERIIVGVPDNKIIGDNKPFIKVFKTDIKL